MHKKTLPENTQHGKEDNDCSKKENIVMSKLFPLTLIHMSLLYPVVPIVCEADSSRNTLNIQTIPHEQAVGTNKRRTYLILLWPQMILVINWLTVSLS